MYSMTESYWNGQAGKIHSWVWVEGHFSAVLDACFMIQSCTKASLLLGWRTSGLQTI